jgi:hypothetical protein
MREPKAPPAARVMAANSLLDRGWGKAAQLVDVQGEIRQLVEVKLSVVEAKPAPTIEHSEAAPVVTPLLPQPDIDIDNTNNISSLDDKGTS